MKKLPKLIHVGPYSYPVYAVKQVDWTENTIACFDPRRGIQIENKLRRDEEGEAFLHELMHAIFYAMNLQKNVILRPHEEEIVSMLTTGLASTFKQNPKLLSYFSEALR